MVKVSQKQQQQQISLNEKLVKVLKAYGLETSYSECSGMCYVSHPNFYAPAHVSIDTKDYEVFELHCKAMYNSAVLVVKKKNLIATLETLFKTHLNKANSLPYVKAPNTVKTTKEVTIQDVETNDVYISDAKVYFTIEKYTNENGTGVSVDIIDVVKNSISVKDLVASCLEDLRERIESDCVS